MKKVLVTGATGFVGNHVVNALLKKGFSVIASSLSEEKAKKQDWFPQVDYKPFDLASASADLDLYQYFCQPDALIHLAWEGLPNYKSVFHMEENLPRHYAFIENLVINGLKNVSVTGTCFEYGMQEGKLSEEMAVFPDNFYAQAKNELRIRLAQLSVKHPVTLKWIRLFYMYGKGQNPNSLLSQLQAALERGDASFNMSPGDQLRDYLPIEKVADNIVKIADQQEVSGIINCCSGNPVQVKELVQEYLNRNNADIKLNLGFYPYSDLEPRNFWGDTTKLKTITDE
ncbi:NAD(P)-dependent oxidoreductase [Terrimonas sp. NA20]|uniref:NAD(P)-dependent oxidoreductase n=1 Tax=Terrimonas ginsenosidimutans TaxID=2908004 RepID=A0ABS9KSX0_9BACT|nr:NAD(P)-dependent oxidoreductase [Terrimonas ginsenosidimutans]MCG2615399.1 NAD(P)-dependent oxidoreductase [Terrimonas ginsenosidimutans]